MLKVEGWRGALILFVMLFLLLEFSETQTQSASETVLGAPYNPIILQSYNPIILPTELLTCINVFPLATQPTSRH
jgi:hypothetical protein